MTTLTTPHLLTEEMLARFDERNPVYDRENRFFDEDWNELKGSGYLLATVPSDMGGAGLGLDEYSKLVRRLAYVAPATALATNMHCYWGGVATDLMHAGDDSCRWVLDKMVEGEVFCALHGEAGNDIPLLLAVASHTPSIVDVALLLALLAAFASVAFVRSAVSRAAPSSDATALK